MLPRRKPFVNGSGGLFSICLMAVSRAGILLVEALLLRQLDTRRS